jgi:hypothetical protein
MVRILDRFRGRRIETIDTGFRRHKEEKAFQLFAGIRSGSFKNDFDAAQTLYNAKPTDTRYSSLKTRLKMRMLNSLFHLDLKHANYSKSAQMFYACQKWRFFAQILLHLDARNAGISMAKRTLDTALYYQFLDIALEMSLHLRTHASYIGNLAMYESYDKILKKILATLDAEYKSWECFDRMQLVLRRKTAGLEKYLPQFTGYINELKPLLNQDSSFTFRLNYYRLLGHILGIERNNKERIETCNEAIAYLKTVPHLAQKMRFGEFEAQKLESYYTIGNYEQTIESARECTALFGYGSNNWFAIIEYSFLSLMNLFDFAKARELYLEITTHPRYPLQPEAYREHWAIFEIYLHYALKRMPDYEKTELRKRYDPDRFLAMSPVARKDKQGLNAALLIVQIMYLLELQQYDAIIIKMEALQTYRTRHVQAKKLAAFFKLLRLMENNSFDYKLCLKKGKPYYEQILTSTEEFHDPEQEIQVLPYTWLWDHALESMQRQSVIIPV